jgi:hypothetical protein
MGNNKGKGRMDERSFVSKAANLKPQINDKQRRTRAQGPHSGHKLYIG